MTNKQQILRAEVLLLALLAGFVVLAGRLVQLQVVEHSQLTTRAEQASEHEFWVAPRRGDILDANGNLLATSIPVETVCADPSLIGGYRRQVARIVAGALKLNENTVCSNLTPRLEWDEHNRLVTNGLHYVRLAQNVSEDDWQRVVTLMASENFGLNTNKMNKAGLRFLHRLQTRAIFAETDQLRVYPNGPLAIQTIGYLGTYGPRDLYVSPLLRTNDRCRRIVAAALAPLFRAPDYTDEREAAMLDRIMRPSDEAVATGRVPEVRVIRGITETNWHQVQARLASLPLAPNEWQLPPAQRAYYQQLRQEGVFSRSVLDVLRTNTLSGDAIASQELHNQVARALKPVGFGGIEEHLEKELCGVPGWRRTSTDRQGRELVEYRDEDVRPRDGLDVVLTIDSELQHIVETILQQGMTTYQPKGITGIVIRPRTGELLAMACLPSYDPGQTNRVPPELRRNRIISDVIEPGSTFKIVVVSGALNDHVVKLTDRFDCHQGVFEYAGKLLHDHEPSGILTVEQIITKSSNIGAAEIAITRLGAPELYRYGVNYGFGQLTVIPLPGESAGVFPDWHKWEKLSLAQFPMGQGISVTRLQIAMAMSAIANGGWLMQPMLISRLQEHHGGVVQRYAPQRIRQVISPEAYRDMLAALKTVPTKEGTCPEAALKNYVVAGKTGTAQVPGKGGYLKGEHVASFIGFFPADHPEVCISVVMDEPTKGYYGGRVCGPVFHDIAERVASYLHIPPDPALLTNLPPASLPAPAGGTGKVPGQALVAGGGGHKI